MVEEGIPMARDTINLHTRRYIGGTMQSTCLGEELEYRNLPHEFNAQGRT